MNAVTYRTRRACVVGGAYRRAGDTFTCPALDPLPAHLEVLGEESTAAEVVDTSSIKTKTRKQTVKEEAQVTAEDMGIVTSPDA